MSNHKRNIKILNELGCQVHFNVVGANEAILCARIATLEDCLEEATNRLSMPIKEIRGDGFRELMKMARMLIS